MIHELTADEFHAARVAEIVTRYACALDEAEDCFRLQESDHFKAIYAAAEAGQTIAERVLDSLHEYRRYRVLHDFPDAHRGYMLPHIRREWEARKPAFDAQQLALEHRQDNEARKAKAQEDESRELEAERVAEAAQVAANIAVREWWEARGLEEMPSCGRQWNQRVYDTWQAKRSNAIAVARANNEFIPAGVLE